MNFGLSSGNILDRRAATISWSVDQQNINLQQS